MIFEQRKPLLMILEKNYIKKMSHFLLFELTSLVDSLKEFKQNLICDSNKTI